MLPPPYTIFSSCIASFVLATYSYSLFDAAVGVPFAFSFSVSLIHIATLYNQDHVVLPAKTRDHTIEDFGHVATIVCFFLPSKKKLALAQNSKGRVLMTQC